MSTFVLMKILESAPRRYDAGICLLTLGRLDGVYDRLVSRIETGQRVLDIGCGTGALTLRAAGRGAYVKGIDVNSQMLEVAQEHLNLAGLRDKVELCEMGIAELESEHDRSYDIVMSGLCFSELNANERAYTLKHAKRILKKGGILLVADEARPETVPKRLLCWLMRIPLVVLTYILTQTTTSAIENLPEQIQAAGFQIISMKSTRLGNFVELVARESSEGT